MDNIANPNKIEFKKGSNDNESEVIVEPCYPGYGMTLGNALRRVLLSSLVGAAVVGVKIKGASHEFSTLPHIKEDVLEIILNIKKLKVKMFNEEEVKLELDVHGKKEVTASDIKSGNVEIVNKDLVIANITDMAGNLSMEITIGKGRGYRPVEAVVVKNKEVDYIDVDAFFSPVVFVGIAVDNVRVGDMTNRDKLSLKIQTDGTITPEEAFNSSVDILEDQFASLKPMKKSDKKDSVKDDESEEVKEEAKEEKKEKATKSKSKK